MINIESSVSDRVLILKLQGDLIGDDCGPEIIGIVNEQLAENVKSCGIDFSEVRFMNSSGLGVLITVHTKFKNRSGEVIIINPSSQIEKLLSITKLDTLFKIVDSAEAAIEALK